MRNPRTHLVHEWPVYSDYEIVVLVSSLLFQLICHLSLQSGAIIWKLDEISSCMKATSSDNYFARKQTVNKAIWQLNLTTKSFEFILLSVIQYSNEDSTCFSATGC